VCTAIQLQQLDNFGAQLPNVPVVRSELQCTKRLKDQFRLDVNSGGAPRKCRRLAAEEFKYLSMRANCIHPDSITGIT
jgi:hypothetical protein